MCSFPVLIVLCECGAACEYVGLWCICVRAAFNNLGGFSAGLLEGLQQLPLLLKIQEHSGILSADWLSGISLGFVACLLCGHD